MLAEAGPRNLAGRVAVATGASFAVTAGDSANVTA
jgi:hypothetical protein